MDMNRFQAEKHAREGHYHYVRGRLNEALRQYHRAFDLYCSASDDRGKVICLNKIGNIYHERGDHEQSLAYFQEGLAIHEKLGDDYDTATAMANLAGELELLGRIDEVRKYYEATIKLAETLNSTLDRDMLLQAARGGLNRMKEGGSEHVA